MSKKTLLMILGGIVVLVIAGAGIFAAMKLQDQGTQSVAPNVPQSKPKAQSAPTSSPLEISFTATSGSSSPSPTPSTSPSPTPTSTAAPAATTASTTAPASTSAPSTGSAQSLPAAGVSLPTIFAVSGGALLLVIGLLLAL